MEDTGTMNLPEAGLHAAAVISAHTLKACRPLLWHTGMQNGGPVRGASAFILRFADRYVGVTADHVIDAFFKAKADERGMPHEEKCEHFVKVGGTVVTVE